MLPRPTAQQVADTLESKGVTVASGKKGINLVGIRQVQRDEFYCDYLAVLFRHTGALELELYPLASDCEQGKDGHLMLAAGHYPDCWRLDVYRGRYRTLVGNKPLHINLCHGEPDPYTLEKRHWAGNTQVLPGTAQLHAVLDRLSASKESIFSYTLIEGGDIATETNGKAAGVAEGKSN